jgi:predicted metalloprotease with PDZ domain
MQIKYTFEFHKNLFITLQIWNHEKDNIHIYLPSEFGGENNLNKEIKLLQSSIPLDKTHIRTTKKDIIIKYTFQNLPTTFNERSRMHVHIENNYVTFNGQNGLIIPKLSNNNKINVTFSTNIKNFFISKFGEIQKYSCNETFDELIGHLFVISKNYISKKNIILTYNCKGQPFIEPKTFLEITYQAYSKMLKFFHLKDNNTFLINLFDRKSKNKNSYGGSGYNYGFEFFITLDEKIFKKNINHYVKDISIYIAHELYHHFNPKTQTEKENWFNEGFTEFFSRLITLSKQEFFKEVNNFIIEYHLNYYKNKNISIMTYENYWKNELIKNLPYVKGFIYALYLLQTYDNQFIKKYKKLCKYKYTHKSSKTLTNNVLKQIISDKNFDKYIIKGKDIPIISKHSQQISTLYFGFDVDEFFMNKTVKNIDQRSDAYKKGLRNGKKYNYWFFYNEKYKSYELIIDNEKSKKIDVNLHSNETINVPFFT